MFPSGDVTDRNLIISSRSLQVHGRGRQGDTQEAGRWTKHFLFQDGNGKIDYNEFVAMMKQY